MSKVAEREEIVRKRILAEFETICPYVIGNPYIPHFPTPPQQLFLGAHLRKREDSRVFECLYGGAAGGGKALPLTERVPTPSGFCAVGELAVGDHVFDRRGRPTTVTHLHAVVVEQGYELTFDDGSAVVANGEHRWLTFDAKELAQLTRLDEGFRARRRASRPSKAKGKKSEAFTAAITARNQRRAGFATLGRPEGTIRTTAEIAASLRTASGRSNHAIPLAGPLQIEDVELPIEPYALGLWLGDGTSANGSMTAHAEDQGIARDAFHAAGFTTRKHSSPFGFGVLGLMVKLRALGLLDNKHVPSVYLRSSAPQRLALLQGLMDSDGHACDSGAVEFCNTNKRLAEAVVELAVSLGHKARWTESRAKLRGKDCGSKYRVKWTAPDPVFRFERKLKKWRPPTRRTTRFRFVTECKTVKAVAMRCITVASQDGMFLVGSSMIPTHNSDAMLMASAQYAWQHGEFSCICFRRTFMDLALPGALMDRALEWWGGRQDVHWAEKTKTFTFASGAKVTFGYLQHDLDHLRYKGAEFHQTNWDELTDFPLEGQYTYVGLSRVRRAADSPIPLRTLSASNPGGPGHPWVKARFIGDADAGVKAPHLYIPARIRDNPHIDRDAYEEGLRDLHPTVRAQLLDGDWRARDPGDYFRAEWFGPLLDPERDIWPSQDCIRIRWWDLAASEKPEAAKTAGVRQARHRSGVRAIEHCRSFRATPGKRDDLIVQTAQADGHGVVVGIEIEGGSGGQAQFDALEVRLREAGFRVVGARPRAELSGPDAKKLMRNPSAPKGKEGRADPVASCLERGYQRRGEGPTTGGMWWGVDRDCPVTEQRDGIRLFAGPWTQDYLDVLEGFPNGATCDEVDATSGGWAWLEAHPFGARKPPRPPRAAQEPAEPQNVHPSDRPQKSKDKDRRGRWRP